MPYIRATFAYGPHPVQETVDVYLPGAAPGSKKASHGNESLTDEVYAFDEVTRAIVFVHGGAWRA